MFRSIFSACATASLAMLAAPAAAVDLLYTLESATRLPSTDTYWDYIRMEPNSSRLFMARVKDGLTVFDVDTRKVIATVDNSKGANGPLLLPAFNRGYVAMTDGSLLSFNLKSLEVIARIPLAKDGGLNSVAYDPATRQIHAIVGTRSAEATWFTLDAASGKLLKKTVFPFRKMDDPAADGEGNLFAPARYDDVVLKLDSRSLAEQERWQIGCHVSKVRYQARSKRILGACLGDKPTFFALNPETGQITARVPIGRGLDGLVIDEQRSRIVSSNGTDGTLTVIGQIGPDEYELLGTVATRTGARMMDLDHRTGRLLVVNADYTLAPPTADGKDGEESFHPDTFMVMSYDPDRNDPERK